MSVPRETVVAVIGTGQMGGALVRGWAKSEIVPPASLRLYDKNQAALDALASETDATPAQDAKDALIGANIVLMGLKPHLIVPVLAGLAPHLAHDCLVVSIAAGVTVAQIEAVLPPGQPVVRVMPNTPALVAAGASAYCRGTSADDTHAATVQALLQSVGVAVEVTEVQIDAVIGVAGSASAYFYLFIEALIDGGVRAGLPRDIARALVVQTALGSAKMVKETGQHPAVLKDAVTTPGGTTIAALDVLEAHGVRGTLIAAVLAARDRAQEMSRG